MFISLINETKSLSFYFILALWKTCKNKNSIHDLEKKGKMWCKYNMFDINFY